MSASAWLASSRNWFPSPLPSCAPGTRPATSISLIGTNRIPDIHNGLLCSILKCLQAQVVFTYATPIFGLIVVKGKFPI